jgi:hypothetical protein
MNSARLAAPGSAVAVWLGANDGLRDWIQGGIEMSYGDKHPWIYLETGHAGRQTKITRIATVFGRTTTFRLVSDGQYWQVVTDGVKSPIRIRLNDPDIQQYVEKHGRGSVSVEIDGVVQYG